MDSVKSIVVVGILLGVLFGIYQVINDDPVTNNTEKPENLLADFDADSKLDNAHDEDDERPAPDDGDDSAADVHLKQPPSTIPPEVTEESPARFKGAPTGESSSSGLNPKSAGASNSDSRPPSSFPFPETNTNSRSFDSGSNSGGFVSRTSETPGANPAFVATSNGSVDTNGPNTTTRTSFNNTASEGNEEASPADGPTADPSQPSWKGSNGDSRSRFHAGTLAEFTTQVSQDMKRAEGLIKADRYADALRILTRLYDDPRLTRQENTNLMSWLDPLAGKVIYSVEHHLTDAYFVRHGDTLTLISATHGVPPELIFNINRVRIPNPKQLVPGTELKMVKGPFHAEVNLSKKILTLFLHDMYAGTFPVRIGTEPVPRPGKYRVLSKSRIGQDYNGPNQQRIPARDENNPYGDFYLNIGSSMSIHGSAKRSDSNDRRGCISLNAVDAEDVYNILTSDSMITIVEK